MRNEPSHQPLPTRKNIRLREWDYKNAGAYHVTICTDNKAKLFGRVVDESGLAIDEDARGDKVRLESATVELNEFGKLCLEALEITANALVGASIDVFIIMPNHVHMLISLEAETKTSLGRIVGKFKSLTSKKVRAISPAANVWQRGFYDHIIRDENDYIRTWEYIASNPVKWLEDTYYM